MTDGVRGVDPFQSAKRATAACPGRAATEIPHGSSGHAPPATRAVPDLEQQPVDRLHFDVGVEQPPRAVPPDRDDDLRVDLLQLDVQLPLVPADVLGGDVLDLGRAPPGPFLDQICYEQVLT